jgi:hypothetical protein
VPTVSILIPAFRPEFLDLSIASALGQTYSDFELIISDDSEGTDVESVVSKWSDPRIRYVKNPNRGLPGANRDYLISLATGMYLKFLHDDDLMFPQVLERMTEAAAKFGAALVFTNWYVIDHLGRPCGSRTFAEAGKERLLSAMEFFEEVIGNSDNFIGGPSNILLDSEAVGAISNPFSLDGLRLRYITDVALFTNLLHRGLKVAAVGVFGTAYRLHEGQYSAQNGPALSALLLEWELFLRWSAEHGHLAPDRYLEAVAPDKRLYVEYVDQYPELAALIELAGRRGSDGKYLSDEFMAAVGTVHSQVDARLARRFAMVEKDSMDHLDRDEGDLDQTPDLTAIREDLARLEDLSREAQARADACCRELEQLRATRTFRYTTFPRRIYSSLRRQAGRGQR